MGRWKTIKKIAIALISLLALSMILMTVAPVLAARTPKPNQVIVKVLDLYGKGIAKTAIYIVQEVTNARTVVLTTKGNGVVVFSLDKNTYTPGWDTTHYLTVLVYNDDLSTYFQFSGYSFDSSFSASIEIETGWLS